MHRWFFADHEIFCKDSTPPPTDNSKLSTSPSLALFTNWNFKVKLDRELCSTESLAISGDCPSLGNWDPQYSLPLTLNENSSLWSLTVSLPRKSDVRYRYLVIALNQRGEKIVRFWETHLGARVVSRAQLEDNKSIEYETFGIFNEELKVERGWLNPYVTVVQFKFYQAPFVLNTKNSQLLLHIKITPIKIKPPEKCEPLLNPILEHGTSERLKISKKNMREVLNETFAYCEVASLQDQNGKFGKQPKYGTSCGPDNLIMFHLTLSDMEHTAYLIDLYNYLPKSAPDIPPNRFGYQYVSPKDLKNSEGTLKLVIMCGTKHRPIGHMKCDYLIIKPTKHSADFNLEKSFERHWNNKHEGMYIGHRGCGKSFWMGKNIIRENTIHSLNLAIQHGADMVEFDIQLTKDKVPVLFHDLRLYLSNTLNTDTQQTDIMRLPLTNNEIELLNLTGKCVNKDFVHFPLSRFTLEQLRRVKVYEPPEESGPTKSCVSNTETNRPFPTLEQVFKEVDSNTGFVIDIKWPQVTDAAKRGSLLSDFDKNVFVDAILHVVLKNAGSRRIIFSSFDADICAMVRLKQNLYPVMFLIQQYSNIIKFVDPRGKFISTGIYFANAMELLGITVNCSEFLSMQGKVSDIHERELCVFSWGTQNRTEEIRKYLKTLGVDGILCDRINHELTPIDLEKTIFNIIPIENPLENNRSKYVTKTLKKLKISCK